MPDTGRYARLGHAGRPPGRRHAATWNALAHRIEDQLISFGLIGIGAIVVAIPLHCGGGHPRAASWPFLLASVAIHVFYNLFLMRSFTSGDFGQVYPLARGTSPLVVTVLAAISPRSDRLPSRSPEC